MNQSLDVRVDPPRTSLAGSLPPRSSRARFSHAGRVGLRMLATAALIGGFIAVAGVGTVSPATAATGTCDGVIVVVDFTDLGGEIDVRCAEGEQATGRAALTAAAFGLTDSQPGFLCAINALPDPCPETFDGSFWAYWHSAPDGEWTSYQVGADSSSPVFGELEGWRYNDGVTPPGIAPSEAVSTVSPAPSPEAIEIPNVAAPGADEQVTNADTTHADQRADQNLVLLVTFAGFVALIAALIIMFVVRQRRLRKEADSPKARD